MQKYEMKKAGYFYEWVNDPDTAACDTGLSRLFPIDLNCETLTIEVYGSGQPDALELTPSDCYTEVLPSAVCRALWYTYMPEEEDGSVWVRLIQNGRVLEPFVEQLLIA